MGDAGIEAAKVALTGAAQVAATSSETIGRLGDDVATVYQGLLINERLINTLINLFPVKATDLQEHASWVRSATAGHQNDSPALGVAEMEQAVSLLEELHAALTRARRHLLDAQNLLADMGNHASSAATHARFASQIFDRYRTTF